VIKKYLSTSNLEMVTSSTVIKKGSLRTIPRRKTMKLPVHVETSSVEIDPPGSR